jgi:hypothetical protein
MQYRPSVSCTPPALGVTPDPSTGCPRPLSHALSHATTVGHRRSVVRLATTKVAHEGMTACS